jgi:methyltransferase (TIGR00027 family)
VLDGRLSTLGGPGHEEHELDLQERALVHERVVSDTLAEVLLPRRYALVAAAARWTPARRAITRFIDVRWPGVRTSVLARTWLIDRIIGDVVDETAQLVILGAGLDTRTWRLPGLAAPTVFEVDHPDTQLRKRALLRRRGLDDARVRFVPTDFTLDRLDTTMAGAGFDPSLPTLFLWEGTTNYLTPAAVDATLRWFARAAAGSRLVFTYIDEDVLQHPGRYAGAERVFATLRRAGEPMTFGLAPDALADYLADRELTLVSDTGAAAYRRQCYGAASASMRGHEFYRLAEARVGAPRPSPGVHGQLAAAPVRNR